MINIQEEKAELSYKPNHVRFFSILLGGLISYLTYLFIPQSYQQIVWICIAIGCSHAMMYPKRLYGAYVYWMIGSMMIGIFVSSIIFTVVYFFGFAIIGRLMKWTKQSPLDLEWKTDRPSYWTPHRTGHSTLEKQY